MRIRHACVTFTILAALGTVTESAWARNQRSVSCLDYLCRYWGVESYSRNFAGLFEGEKPRIAFVSQSQMLGLLNELCSRERIHCNAHSEYVLGKSLPNGRIVVVKGLVDPLFEAMFVLHELHHDLDDPSLTSAENEVRAWMTLLDFFKHIFGEAWLADTMGGLKRSEQALQIDGGLYRSPNGTSVHFLAKQLQKAGVMLQSNQYQEAILWNVSIFLTNDFRALISPVFQRAYEARRG